MPTPCYCGIWPALANVNLSDYAESAATVKQTVRRSAICQSQAYSGLISRRSRRRVNTPLSRRAGPCDRHDQVRSATHGPVVAIERKASSDDLRGVLDLARGRRALRLRAPFDEIRILSEARRIVERAAAHQEAEAEQEAENGKAPALIEESGALTLVLLVHLWWS